MITTRIWTSVFFALAAVLLLTPCALAQNTGGVFGPKVSGDERQAEYRFGFVPEEDGADHRYAHRLHGALALDNRRMARVVVQGADQGGPNGFDFQFLQAELFWELSDEQAQDWNYGIRLDARISGDNRPDQLGFNWSNQFRLTDDFFARAVLLTAVQFGDNSADGVLLSARGSLNYKLADGYALSLQSFNSLGSTEDFGTENRSQQLGPMMSGPLEQGWYWQAGALFGVGNAAPDSDLRVWIGKNF